MLISVIIATYNRCESLRKVLEGLLVQEKSTFTYEVIIVDNNSTDQTQGVVASFKEEYRENSIDLLYLHEDRKGKSFALNMGIQHAKGDIVAFTDNDVLIDKNWLRSLKECFESQGCDGIGGRVLPLYPESTPSWVKENPHQMAGVVVIYDQGDVSHSVNEKTERFIGCNWAFKKEVFRECGDFRTDLGPGTSMMGEDEEFYHRLLSKNKKLYYCSHALIFHPVDLERLSLKNTASWHICLGRFHAYKEMQTGQNIIKCFGVPRYLIKEIFIDSFNVLLKCYNRFAFWNAFRKLFFSVGKIRQYQGCKKI